MHQIALLAAGVVLLVIVMMVIPKLYWKVLMASNSGSQNA